MRVIFDSCVYDLRNKGNVAMLQTAVNRIRDFWPDAKLEVITSAPYLLRLYCPNARPISPTGIDFWYEHRTIADGVLQKLPVFLLWIMLEIRESIWQQFRRGRNFGANLSKSLPAPAEQFTVSKSHENDCKGNYREFLDAKVLDGLDLYIATGGHYLTDIMNYDVLAVLDRLERMTQLGIPTAMVGQGIGPIHDPKLVNRAKTVLPKVDLFLVREKIEAPYILSELGVDPSRVFVTGDDAVELAHVAASNKLGRNIGVGFRVAHTTEANSRHMDVLRPAFQKAAEKYKCKLIGLPVSQSAHELDQKIIEYVSSGSRLRRSFLQRLSDPKQIIKDTSLCRIVITGTYHTAVFALAQGIPVIGLVKSASYSNKFAGLADQYEGGLCILQLDDEYLYDKTLIAIDHIWEIAETIKPKLLDAASRQIESGHKGYNLIYEVLNKNHRK